MTRSGTRIEGRKTPIENLKYRHCTSLRVFRVVLAVVTCRRVRGDGSSGVSEAIFLIAPRPIELHKSPCGEVRYGEIRDAFPSPFSNHKGSDKQ